MRKEDCAYHNEWVSSYKKEYITQNDWNQTLVTKINQISAQIHNGTFIGCGNKLIAHPNKRSLFETLLYYDSGTQRIAGRYNVVFDDECENNIIYVYYDKIDNPNHVYMGVRNGENGMIEMYPTFNPNEIIELKKKYCGYILIKINFKYGKEI